MIPSKYRLKKKTEIAKVFNTHKSYLGEFLSVLINLAPSAENCRMVVVISRKISPKAVQRNKLRRKIMFIFYETLKNWPLSQIGDMVIIVNKVPEDLSQIVKERDEFIKWLKKSL